MADRRGGPDEPARAGAAATPGAGGDQAPAARQEAAPDGGWTVPAPVTGKVVPLDDVPDPVFAQRMVGDGAAILPAAGEVLAPVAGTVTALFPTGHAVGLRTDDGLELLIHVGIDSSHAEGAFTARVAVGDRVQAGQVLVVADLERLALGARSPVSPVLVTNLDQLGATVEVTGAGQVTAGRDPLFRVRPAAGTAPRPGGHGERERQREGQG